MAVDEKILGLIAEAEAFTPLSVLGKPIARELDRAILLIHRLAGVIEAELLGDDDWEYGVTSKWGIFAKYSREAAEAYGERLRASIESGRESGDPMRHGRVMRRRPPGEPGPWEPVEEVPRG